MHPHFLLFDFPRENTEYLAFFPLRSNSMMLRLCNRAFIFAGAVSNISDNSFHFKSMHL